MSDRLGPAADHGNVGIEKRVLDRATKHQSGSTQAKFAASSMLPLPS